MDNDSSASSDLTSLRSQSARSLRSLRSLPLDSPAARSRRLSTRSLLLENHNSKKLHQIAVVSIPPYTYSGKKGEIVPINVENVFIDPSVQVVGEKSFSGCTKLKSIVIPSSTVSIESNAFYGCTSLTSIVIPESVTEIGAYSFHGCTSLAPITIPTSVKTIGRNAFYRCTMLESIEIPDSVTSIGELAFSECTSLKSVILPSSINIVGWGTFSRCSSLISVTIPESVTMIDWGAFAECISLTSVIIPSGIKVIGESTFEGCTSLSVVAIPELLSNVGDRCFGECPLLKKGAEKLGTDIFGWLRTRFDFMPLHQVCYKRDITKERISDCLANHPNSIRALDSLGMSPLMILLLNQSMTTEMVEDMLNIYPDLVKIAGPRERFPLHVACSVPHATFSVIKLLSTSLTNDGKLVLAVKDGNGAFPCTLAIKNNRSDDIILYLYERFPIKASNLGSKAGVEKVERIRDQYVKHLSKLTESTVAMFDSLQQHGWVSFVSMAVEGSNISRKCVYLIEERALEVVRALATFTDLQGRTAIKQASAEIRAALEKRLLLFSRYEPVKAAPIHKGSRSLVIKAIDRKPEEAFRSAFELALSNTSHSQARSLDNDGFKAFLNYLGVGCDDKMIEEYFERWRSDSDSRISESRSIEFCTNVLFVGRFREVAIKFMSNSEQFRLELDLRENLRLDPRFVVHVEESFSFDAPEQLFSNSLRLIKVDESSVHNIEYNHALVMPLAARNLDTIFRNERPQPVEIRTLAEQLAFSILHLHDKGLIHNDVNPQNVVRLGDHLRLLDLSTATYLDDNICTARLSGVYPPEVIAKLSADECKILDKCFSSVEEKHRKPLKTILCGQNFFTVRTCVVNEKQGVQETVQDISDVLPCKEEKDDSMLPYSCIKASKTFDIWSFGVILYTLYTGSTLFEVNRDYELANCEAIEDLYDWNESQRLLKLSSVKDLFIHRLLRKCLERNPSERFQSMKSILDHEFFSQQYFLSHALSNDCKSKAKDAIDRVTIKLWHTDKGTSNLMSSSASGVLSTILDAVEVYFPVCFIILPYQDIPRCLIPDEDSYNGKLDTIEQAVSYAEFLIDIIFSSKSLDTFVSEYLKHLPINSKMYFFLVDESTGESVFIDDEYPLEIDVRAEEVQRFLRLMVLGIRAVAVAKSSTGVMNMFFPGVPQSQIPMRLWKSVEAFVSKFSSIELKENPLDGKSYTNELLALFDFLGKKDRDYKFSGLRRVFDTTSKTGIWAKHQNAEKFERTSEKNEGAELRKLKSENEVLITKLKVLSSEKKILEESNITLQEKVKFWMERAQRLNVASKTNTSNANLEDVKRLNDEKHVLLSQIKDLSAENKNLENSKSVLEKNLKASLEKSRAMEAAISEAKKGSDPQEIKQLKKEKQELIEAIRALALANSKLAWRPRNAG